MDRREFLGGMAAAPLLAGASFPRPESELSDIGEPVLTEPPDGVPVIRFDENGQLENIEEIVQNDLIFDDDIMPKVYEAWLNREDYVIGFFPYAYRGAFWGLCYVEVAYVEVAQGPEFRPVSYIGQIQPMTKSNRLELGRKSQFSWFRHENN